MLLSSLHSLTNKERNGWTWWGFTLSTSGRYYPGQQLLQKRKKKFLQYWSGRKIKKGLGVVLSLSLRRLLGGSAMTKASPAPQLCAAAGKLPSVPSLLPC